MRLSLVGQYDIYLLFMEILLHPLDLDIHNLLKQHRIKGIKDDYLVDAVKKLGLKGSPEIVHHFVP